MLLKYFINIRDTHEIPEPKFTQSFMNHNTLYFREQKISDEISEALKKFLADTDDQPEYWVQKLIIDGCNMSTYAFKNIIDGIMKQGTHIK